MNKGEYGEPWKADRRPSTHCIRDGRGQWLYPTALLDMLKRDRVDDRVIDCVNALAGIKGNPEDIRAVLMAARALNTAGMDAFTSDWRALSEALSKIQFPEE